MASASSKAQQHRAVGEGLAVGCLILGRTELPSRKTHVELAFQRAWRAWPPARDFPQVRADLGRNDIYFQIIEKSARRRGPLIAWWEMGRTLRPQSVSGNCDLSDARELLVEFYGLPVEAWVELARAFVGGLVKDEAGAATW